MTTYVLTFTKDADRFNLRHQQESIDYNNDNCYFKNINSYMDYDKVDRAIREAKENNFDNFILLAEDNDDIDDIYMCLQEDYADDFANIDVMPEQFFRYREADQAMGNQGQATQPVGNQQTTQQQQQQAQKQQAQVQKQQTQDQVKNNNNQTMLRGNTTNTKTQEVSLICFDANYPTAKNWQKLVEGYNKAIKANNNYCFCWSHYIKGQQYIKGGSVPEFYNNYPDDTIKNQFAQSLGGENGKGAQVIANPLQQESLAVIVPDILNHFPKCTTVKIYSSNPNVFTGKISTQTNTINFVKGEQLQPMFDANENQTIFQLLSKLKENKDSKINELKKGDVSEDEVAKEEQKNAAGNAKDQKDVEKMQKDEMQRYQDEVQSGWIAYVDKLITSTESCQQNPEEETKGEEATKAYFKELRDYWKDMLMKDINSFDQSLENVGLGWAKKSLEKAAAGVKDALKTKAKKPKPEQQAAIAMANSEEYIKLKQLLGGK